MIIKGKSRAGPSQLARHLGRADTNERVEILQLDSAGTTEQAFRDWQIHDYEGFASIRINEYDSFERVAELAAFIAEHGALGAELIDHFCGDLDEARSALEDRHLGQYQSLADYVQEVTEETTAIPEALRYYVDYDAIARDAELNGDLFTIQTAHDAVHVFVGC